MMVTDLAHVHLTSDMPTASRHLGWYLNDIVRAATAGDAGVEWTSVLACRRSPAGQPCPGRLVVGRAEPEPAVYRMFVRPRSPDFFVLSAGTTDLEEFSDCLVCGGQPRIPAAAVRSARCGVRLAGLAALMLF